MSIRSRGRFWNSTPPVSEARAIDLTAAIGSPRDVVLVEARDIAETGAIVGWAWFGASTQPENHRAFVLVPAPPSPADLDGDGAVGAGDLAILLGAWS